MEVGTQIKKYRNDIQLSQEELAEKVHVSRQTISNWETGKNYPDIHSLLLLGSVFNVSLDQLIKGDVETMKEKIKETEIKKLKQCDIIFTVLLLATVVSAVPLTVWLGIYGILLWGALLGATLFFAYKVERIKKENDIYTYKEITAFMDGRRLNEMERQQERAKLPYQRILLTLAAGLFALSVCVILGCIFL